MKILKKFLVLSISLSMLMIIGIGLFSVVEAASIDEDGLLVWLDASYLELNDGESVEKWEDRSGNNNHAIQEDSDRMPSYKENALNENAVINFKEDFMVIDFEKEYEQPFTAFVVFQITQDADEGDDHQIFDGAYGARFRLGISVYEFIFAAIDQWGPPLEEDFFLPTEGFQQISVLYNLEGSDSLMRLNSEEVDSSTGMNEAPVTDITIGAQNSHIQQFFAGDMAEIILYNRELSEEEIIEVENYLQEKYNL